MLESDPEKAARMLIDLFELDAAWYAEFRAYDLLEQGEGTRAHAWEQIGVTIQKVQPNDLLDRAVFKRNFRLIKGGRTDGGEP